MPQCIDCKKPFTKSGRNQKRCGSANNKTGCSYIRHRYLDRHNKDGSKRVWRGSTNSVPMRTRILQERGLKCQKCGIENEQAGFFDLDHIVPRRKVGIAYYRAVTGDQRDNLQVLCPNCHRIKTLSEGWRN